jgi:hypothetical protein
MEFFVRDDEMLGLYVDEGICQPVHEGEKIEMIRA